MTFKKNIISGQNKYLKNSNSAMTHDTVLIAFFGALWGLMEITIGVVLKGLKIPFGGRILTCAAIVIFLTGYYFTQRKRSIILMSGIAAFFKIFSFGTFIFGPLIAIMIEGFIGEVITSIFGKRKLSFIITGITLLLYTMIYPLFTAGFIYGFNIYKVLIEIFKQISKHLNLTNENIYFIVSIYVLLHILVGAFAGWIAFNLTKRVEKELIIRKAAAI